MNRPTYQRKQAHRRRRALGRAMHQVRRMRWQRPAITSVRQTGLRLHVPKMLRKHARLLRHTFAVLGS